MTSGSVQRLIDQASTAEVTLRNPDRIFTVTPTNDMPAFHPMDAITIYLERIKGYPVQVFTGYLDDTPYYQMYPGTITLQATCTLKRLVYTYFDPSLPYVNSFFAYYGWVADQQGHIYSTKALANAEPAGNTGGLGGLNTVGGATNSSNALLPIQDKGNAKSIAHNAKVSGQSANGGSSTTGQTASGTTLNDGSIGELLYATLLDIGQWDDANIYIENLPAGSDGLGARIAVLMQNLLTQESTAASELGTFMDSVIGSGSSGSGGGSGNSNNKSSSSGSGSGTGSYGNAPKTPAGGYNRKTWCATLLGMLSGINQTDTNMQMVYAWTNAEGGAGPQWGNSNNTANYNPLNTTQGMPGSTAIPGDSAPVQSYTNWAEGLVATAETLTNGNYGELLADLKNSNAQDFSTNSQLTTWGTGPVSLSSIQSAPGGMSSVQGAGVAAGGSNPKSNIGGSSNQGADSTNVSSIQLISNDTTLSKRSSVNIGGQTNAGSYTTTNQKGGGNAKTNDQMTVLTAIKEACNAIASKNYPYVYAGGHGSIGIPSGGPPPGYDCSGAVSAVMGAAQLMTTPAASGRMQAALGSAVADGEDSSSGAVNIYANSEHVYMQVDGRYWSSDDIGNGPAWRTSATQAGGGSGFTAFHIKKNILSQSCTYSLGVTGSSTVQGAGAGGGVGAGTSSSGNSQAGSEAFTAQLEFPSIQDMSMALMLGSEGNGLMHDQQLLPFIQQLTSASMRSFQSLPNGDFFAFYPDYFGEFNQHPAYWEIDDLEILTGDIYLNDQSLVTHQYVVGDNTYPADAGMYNQLFSTGVVTIYNAFQPGGGILSSAADPTTASTGGSFSESGEPQKSKLEKTSYTDSSNQRKVKSKSKQTKSSTTSTAASDPNNTLNIMDQDEALEFVKRYGARPQVSNYPQVRSSLFEMYLAYQQFMISWANQFRTTFSFTFMPEIFPGGKVAFPTHGLQMYVSSVTHAFDYEEGFTTDAVLTAPSQLPGAKSYDLPPDMVQALVKPIRAAAAASANGKPSAAKSGGVASSLTSAGSAVKGL